MFLRSFIMAEIEEEQHQDFIWTWKSNGRGNKVSVWLPYFSEVSKNNDTGKKFSGLIKKSACLLLPLNIEV